MPTTGRIYKITSQFTDRIYIGSTTETLSHRLSRHKSRYKSVQAGKPDWCSTVRELIELGEVAIELLEEIDFTLKKELFVRERWYIEQNKNRVVNKMIPTRTMKEYRQENCEILKQKAKEYRLANRDKINEKNKIYKQNRKIEQNATHQTQCIPEHGSGQGGQDQTNNESK